MNSVMEPLGLGSVQRRRKRALWIAGFATAALLPFVRSWPDDGLWHETVEQLGMAAITLAILGRCWCTLYIGGRKGHEIVDVGPYSVSRNPLYLFSVVGVMGLGAQMGSVLLALGLSAVAFAIFRAVIVKEEDALRRRFGADYAAYLQRVPRLWPRLSGWRDRTAVVSSPRLFLLTARESMLLLLAFPLCEAIEWLQDSGHIVAVIHLP